MYTYFSIEKDVPNKTWLEKQGNSWRYFRVEVYKNSSPVDLYYYLIDIDCSDCFSSWVDDFESHSKFTPRGLVEHYEAVNNCTVVLFNREMYLNQTTSGQRTNV